MKIGTALTALAFSAPALATCSVFTYWAISASGWWLIGTVFSLGLFPTATERTLTKGDLAIVNAEVKL